MRHTISILVENTFGALTRVAGMFSGRGYNIDSLNVAPTHNPEVSRMTIVTRGDDDTLEQVVRQLEKLVNVIEITDIFRAKIVDVQAKSMTIEVTGNENKVEKFIHLMGNFGILTLTRTGKVALPRD